MLLIEKNQKEERERERQLSIIREYNQKKKDLYEIRLSKFLNLYPYSSKLHNYGLNKFFKIVNEASLAELNTIIKLFNKENAYWNSYYVLRRCNAITHNHIIYILKNMHYCIDEKIKKINIEESNYKKNISSGDNSDRGEKEVEYVLKWLTNDYIVIDKNCKNKYGKNCILLKNDKFIDEIQEYDHIVIGPQGIFLIETKNYSGKLYIDDCGNWLRMKNGKNEWESEINPTQQVSRHHLLVESIVGSSIPIIDIICLAHPNLIISGQKNSKIPVIRKDLLGNFIMSYKNNILDKNEIKKIEQKIELHKSNIN